MNTSAWKILVVEDEYDSIQVVSQVLEHHDIQIYVARDGQECLEVVEKIMPTLVIMDLAMPKLDGWQTLVAMRSNPATAHIPIVATTAYHSAEVAKDTVKAGFDAYYPKPIDPASFVDSLAQIIGTTP